MTDETKGSISQWIGALQDGGDVNEAAQRLWERYFDKLVNLARGKLRTAPRGPADEEDVALSAFESFCAAAAAHRFPQLGAREDLWRLLVTITVRKANAMRQRELRQKRGGGRVLGEAALAGPDQDARGGLDQVADPEPTPEFAALVADELGRLLGLLREETLRQVAVLRMEGYSNEQVAGRLGCSLRSIERKLDLIRRSWELEDRE
jgi:DNA-directed RNA polymerase specialized sigma24 family protein